MPSETTIAEHREIQQAAKAVLSELAEQITAVDTERSIADKAYAGLCRHGLTETWYYSCPALVLLGSRSCLSISGRDYEPGLEPVGEFNLVTVDVSPLRDGRWGDCARSFFIEQGRATNEPSSPELQIGRRFLASLHADMPAFVRPETTFHELFQWAERRIAAAGFELLDFLANVGHSLGTRREERQFIQEQNPLCLNEVPFFTFEPHVRTVGGRWGFKREDIFFFRQDGRLDIL
ncbi:MAG: M24 family metallopeptidase [Pirellulales bacterium]